MRYFVYFNIVWRVKMYLKFSINAQTAIAIDFVLFRS